MKITKEQNRIYHKTYALRHPEVLKAIAHRSWEKNGRKLLAERKLVLKEAKNKSCMDCGVQYPYYVMDLDHRDPTQKTKAVSQMLRRCGLETLKKEIAKCDLVCANCHRIRTFNNRGIA